MTTKNEPKTGADVFASPLNIQIGRGRILWGEATTDRLGNAYPAGWVLPGGARTAVRAHAEAAAQHINQLSK